MRSGPPRARRAAGSAQVAERLRTHFRGMRGAAVASAWLFGSHGESRAHSESDVDVGVLLDRRLAPTARERFDLRVRLTSDLIHALRNNDVDLLVLNDAPPLLARRIIRTGIEVFCRDPGLARDFRRDVQIRAADLAPFLERYRRMTLDALGRLTFLLDRLSELRKHLDHLEELRPRISATALRRDLSLHNDVLFSLLTVCQLVIDVASELSARHGLAFDDYTEAVRNLGRLDLVDDATLAALDGMPGFRNVLVHEYVTLDLERVVQATDRLQPVRTLLEAVRRYAANG